MAKKDKHKRPRKPRSNPAYRSFPAPMIEDSIGNLMVMAAISDLTLSEKIVTASLINEFKFILIKGRSVTDRAPISLKPEDG